MRRLQNWLTDEVGSAMAMGLVALLMISMLIGIVTISTISSIDRVKNKSAASTGLATADRALVVYQHALQSRLATEGTYYAVSGRDLEQALLASSRGAVASASSASRPAGGSNAVVIRNRDLPNPFKQMYLHQTLNKSLERLTPSRRSVYQYTVREDISESAYGYWQLLEVIQPDFSDGDSSKVVAYLRAWTGSKSTNRVVVEPRIIRAEYRPGRFADYQMISDGPIDITLDGVTIAGPIHTNGYRDRYMSDDSSGIHIRDEASSTKCDKEKGDPSFSTTRGPIRVGASASCSRASVPKRDNTNIEISFLRVEESFQYLRDNCGVRRVYCPFPFAGEYRVHLSHRNVNINGQNFPAPYRNEADIRAFHLRGNVHLSGVYSGGELGGRITIAAERANRWGKPAEILLDGGNGNREIGSASSRDIVGLMAQGNITLGGFSTFNTRHSCPSVIRAAMIAESGAVSIPEQWLTAGLPPIQVTPRLKCNEVTIVGSMAGHFAPTLASSWIDEYGKRSKEKQVGYEKRVLKYNHRLYRNPPPYFPLTGPWQIVDFSDANYDCVNGSQELDATCR